MYEYKTLQVEKGIEKGQLTRMNFSIICLSNRYPEVFETTGHSVGFFETAAKNNLTENKQTGVQID